MHFLCKLTVGLIAALTALAFAPAIHAHDGAKPGIDPGRALDPGLGKLSHPVSTRNKQAQAFFDQGLKLCYAFNHEGAVAAFKRAADLDPQLAMAHWGVAYALGPNYNVPMSPEAHKAAYLAIQRALALRAKASPTEQAYIDALSRRYSSNPADDPAALNLAYKDAMADLLARHPRDVDAVVLYAESLMLLQPWKLWSPDGKPLGSTPEIVSVLERALKARPKHPGANHLYIHAMEMSPTPEKALPSAKRLEKLAPSAGHLVHMPAHTYIRTGNYLDAARVNERAVLADERLRAAGVQSLYTVGYYGHNLHFLAVSYGLAGNATKSIANARKLAQLVEPQIKDMPWLDGYHATPAQVLVLFERWDDVLALPEPPFEAPFSNALWHFARALAFGGKGQLNEARAERDKFAAAAGSVPKTTEIGLNTAAAVFAVALPYLDGRLALMSNDAAGAVPALREAAAAEDALNYDEPPAWYLGSYSALGTALLKSGDAGGAEQAFRADLRHNVGSGRSLFGLQTALRLQGKKGDAGKVKKQFDQAWRGATIKLAAG
jgi:tetratricopeptide (TPR) repeat protein